MRTRILSFICGALLAVTATAQPHLSFKGIPITGSMTSFCQQLKLKALLRLVLTIILRLLLVILLGVRLM